MFHGGAGGGDDLIQAPSQGAQYPRTAAALPRGERLLVVSPHADDAALSCSALLAREQPVDVLTVFAGSGGSRDIRTRSYLATRLAEERRAYVDGPHRVTVLGLSDPSVADGPRPPADAEAIGHAILAWLRDGGGVVALPVGAGCRWGRVRARAGWVPRVRSGPMRHADHIFTRDAGLSALTRRDDCAVLLYEELPYLWCQGGERQARLMGRRHRRAVERVEVAIDRDVKAARLSAYATQVAMLGGDRGRLDDPAVLPGVELYWWLSAATGHAPALDGPDA